MRGYKIVVERTLKALACGAVLVSDGALAADDAAVQALLDRAAIQNLLVRYVSALDTRDADAYAQVFSEDAEFEVGGTLYRGRAEIRGIVTRLAEGRRAREANAEPVVDLYHTLTNTAIELIDDDEARHESYYQTVRVAPGERVVIGTMGRYEDMLVKRDGQWFIRSRKAVNFTR
jgi:uncharacterized protein (TIGR02246 family)